MFQSFVSASVQLDFMRFLDSFSLISSSVLPARGLDDGVGKFRLKNGDASSDWLSRVSARRIHQSEAAELFPCDVIVVWMTYKPTGRFLVT